MKNPQLEKTAAAAPSRRQGAWDISVHADEIYAPSAGLEPALALLQRNGIKHTTLRVTNGRDSVVRLTNAQLDELAKLLKKYDIGAAAIETPVFKSPLRRNNAIAWGYCPGFSSDMSLLDHFWCLSRAIEIADRLGVPEIRCFAFWREYPLDEALSAIVDRLGQAADRAKAAGRTIHLQNQPDTLAGTGVELARIIRAVGSPHLRAAYDLANSARLAGDPVRQDYPALKGLLGAVQVRFQVIDIRSGTGHPSPDLADPTFPYPPYFIWQQEPLPIAGWVQLDGKMFDLTGERTFVPIEDTIGLGHRAFFTQLKNDGYDGLISVDSSYYLPESAITNREIEAGFGRTIASLQGLLQEIWS